jgi:glycosyltransferase involved in cell wall biosynthesis
MLWGRLAAPLAGVPVVLSAIHSTGFPDRIGRLNRMLTPLTSMFIGVADTHGRYLVEQERFPAEKVRVIPNGIDTERFHPHAADPHLRRQVGLSPGPIAGTVARLGPEKNHGLFLDVAARTRQKVPDAQFLLIGDGPLADALRQRACQLGIADCVHFLGWRSDVAEVLGLMDVFLLTSHIEANPISILEALASGKPIVSTRVGSVAETVHTDAGYLVEPGDAAGMAEHLVQLFQNPTLARTMGIAGRESVVLRWSLDQMVRRYEDLIETTYCHQRQPQPSHQAAIWSRSIDRRQSEERAACP